MTHREVIVTDRRSHFCQTRQAGQAPTTEHAGQVSRARKVVGIQQILAWSPQARGRSAGAFQTIQGRLPQELRAAVIHSYAPAKHDLAQQFLPDFNGRFTVAPACRWSAWTSSCSWSRQGAPPRKTIRPPVASKKLEQHQQRSGESVRRVPHRRERLLGALGHVDLARWLWVQTPADEG